MTSPQQKGTDPTLLGARCSECPFAKDGKACNPVPVQFPEKPKFLVVGEFPNREEAEAGKPYLGQVGQQFNEELLQAKLGRWDAVVALAIACKPGLRTEANMKKAVLACRPYLWAQLRKLKRREGGPGKLPVLLMGKLAAIAFTGKDKGATSGRGFVQTFHGKWGEWPGIVTWQPSYAFYGNPYEWGAFSLDVARFARLLRGELRTERKLHIHPTEEEVEQFFSSCLARKQAVAVDIETGAAPGDRPDPKKPEHTLKRTGLNPLAARLKTIAFGSGSEGIALLWETASAKMRALVKRWLENPHVVKVFHNGPWFDMRVLERYGIAVQNWEDTRDLRRALSATSALSLGYVASLYNDTNNWKKDEAASEDGDAKGLAFTEDTDKLLRYNAQDTTETSLVWEAMAEELKNARPEVGQLYSMNKELSLLCAEMHTHGIQFDTRMQRHIARVLTAQVEKSRRELLAMVRELGPNEGWEPTAQKMAALIFRACAKPGWTNFDLHDPIDEKCYTPTGRISVDHDSLLSLIVTGQTPKELTRIIEQWWRLEGTKKALGTFVVSKLVTRAIMEDGRLHPGWNSLGTDTGRFSCSEPNVMNILQSLRRMYRASPGGVLVHADKKSFELNVMAAVSGDKALNAGLEKGDIYSEDAKEYFNLPADMNVKKEKKDLRQACKIIRLASQYWAGTPAVYAQAITSMRTLTYERVAVLHKKFLERSSGLVAYWNAEVERVHRTGYSETRVLKRRRVYPAEPPPNEIVNYPIQGTAADIMNIEILKVHKALKKHVPGAKLIIQLHDALDIDAPRRKRGDVVRILEDNMQGEYEIEGRKRTFGVDIKDGIRWNEVA